MARKATRKVWVRFHDLALRKAAAETFDWIRTFYEDAFSLKGYYSITLMANTVTISTTYAINLSKVMEMIGEALAVRGWGSVTIEVNKAATVHGVTYARVTF